MLVPAVVRNKALAVGASRWLDELPGLIAGLERDWGITVGPAYPDATEAFVAEARPPSVLRHGDPWDRARWLARRCGLDATAIWEWGVVERVSTGLLATRIGLQPLGREMLATADLVAA